MLIRNGWVVTMDDAIGELRRGSVLIDGSRTAAVGAELDAPDGCE